MEEEIICDPQTVINDLQSVLRTTAKAAKKRNAKAELLEKYAVLLNCYNRILQTQLKIDDFKDPFVHGNPQSSGPRYQKG